MRIAIIFLLTIILFGTSCTKEHDMVLIEEEPFVPVTNLEIESLVISIGDDIPFTCLINNQVYTSEGGGILLIEKLLLDQISNSVLIQSDGYYDEIRYVIPYLNANLHLEVKLTSLLPSGGLTTEIDGFNAQNGGTIDVYRSIITFEPNTIVDEAGELYIGEVNVLATNVFSAAYASTIRRFPQNVIVEDRKLNTLNIIGGHNLLLRDEMMNPLYFKEGSSANIRFRHSGSSNVAIPDDLKMRAYNADSDEWINMGTAEKDGEEWQGRIDNLGLIVWGVEYGSRIAQMKLVTEEGVIIPNKFVWLYTDFETPVSMSFSDSEGYIRIHVPIGVEYFVRTLNRNAINTNPLSDKEYPIVSNGNLDILNFDDFVLTSEYYQNYNGSVIGCQSNTILNSAIIGQAPTEFGKSDFDAYVFSDENGMFDFAYPIVNSDQIKLNAYDFDLGQTSQEFFIDNNDEVNVDFGELLVCE